MDFRRFSKSSTVQRLTANPTGVNNYSFVCTSANATIGATFTNNGQTFTVLETISSGTLLFCSGTGTPSSSGTLTKSAGTGDSTITFSAFSGCYARPSGTKFLKVKAVGGGGGGGSSSTTTNAAGTAGGDTFFGTSLLRANGGAGNNGAAVSGGSVSISAPAISLVAIQGEGGGGKSVCFTTAIIGIRGERGGASVFGGAGNGGTYNGDGQAAIANSGSGGGGSGGETTGGGNVDVWGGGAAGGYLEAIVPNPSAYYSFTIGAAGAAATGNRQNGGAGSTGVVIVEECY